MFYNLLASDSSSAIILLVMLGLFAVFGIVSSRSQKKKQQETVNMRNSIQAGDKITTIGGIIGVVVEVNNEENSFVLVTGSEKAGKSFVKFDKQAIYNVVKKEEPVKEEPKEEVKEEPKEEKSEEKTEE